jgi:hypothetical protein
MGDTFNQSHSGSGHNIINFGRQRLEMTEDAMQTIVRQIGEPRTLQLWAIGAERSAHAVTKLASYLQNSGFNIRGINRADIMGPPLNGPVELRGDDLFVDVDR